jgi:PAS domain S-box-containing protein
MKTRNNRAEPASLRKKALELHKKKQAKPGKKLSHADTLKLIHELEVRQIELELQNEDLIQASSNLQDELHFQEMLNSSITQTAADAIISINANGEIISWNKAAEQIFGYTASEMMNAGLRNIIPVRHQAAHLSGMQGLKKGGFKGLLGKVIETTAMHKDGTEFPVELSISCWEANNQKNYTGIIRDVTSRKQAEEKLIESEQQYLDFFEKDISGIYLSTPQGKLLNCNPAFAKMLGYSVSEILKLNPAKLYPHPTNRIDFISHLTKNRNLIDSEIKLVTKDGRIITCIENVAGVFNQNGELIQFHGYILDITKRKLAEQELVDSKNRFEELVDLLPEAVFETDKDLNLTYTNQRAIELTGYSKDDFAKGMSGLDMLAPEDRGRAMAYFRLRMKGDNPGTLDYRAMKKDGSTYPILFHASPIIRQGKISGVRGIIIDITKFKQAEEDIRHENVRFQELVNTINSGVAIFKVLNDGESGKDYIIQDFNRAALKIEGLTKEKVVGKSLFDLRPAIDDYGLISTFREVWKTGKAAFYPATVYIDEHFSSYYENRVFRLPNGEIVAVYDDVTDRENAAIKIKESQERFDLAMKAAKDGVYDWNLLSNEIYYSPGWKSMLGYRDEELPNDFSVWEKLTSPEDVKKSWAMLDELINKKRDRFELEFKMKHKDGHWVNVLSRAEAVFDASGKAVRVVGTHVDISERILAEEKVLKEKTKTQQYLDIADVMLISIDSSGIVQLINPKGCKILGYSEEEILGKNWYDNFLPERVRENVKVVAKKVFSGEIESVEYFENEILTKSGQEKLISWNNAVLKDDTGKITGTLSSGEDITERRRAEITLRESEQKLRNIFENSTNMFYSHTPEHMLTYVSPQVEIILGYTVEETLVKWTDLASDNPLNEIGFEITKIAIESGKRQAPYQLELVNKDGTKIWVEVREFPVVEKGKTIGISGSLADITERKHADQIRTVLFNISNRAIRTDDLNKFIWFIREELGTIIDTTNFYIALYDENTDTLSLPFFKDEKDNISSLPAGKTLTSYVIKTKRSLLATQKVKYKLEQAGEIELFGTDSEVWLGVPLKIDGAVMGVVVVQSYTDKNAFSKSDQKMLEFVSDQISISIDRKQAEDNLLSALQKAQESDRLKSAFLAAMSHELRTPLTAIIGFSEIIDDEPLPVEDILEYNKTILSSGNHLLRIVEDIFDITLIESGEIKLEKSDVELGHILNNVYEIIKIHQHEANKEYIALNLITAQHGTDLVVNTDPSKLKQILINLVKNAINFTISGNINFGYRIVSEQGNPMLKFFVEDTGIGIPKGKQDIIFDVFRQLDDSYTRKVGGTGLGLAISKKLTELLGGRIWLDSEEGKGSTFYFTIPLGHNNEMDTSKINAKEMKIDLTGKTILIVEDVENSYEFLKIVIEKSGANTLWACNGEESISCCRENDSIDLVLMDINMPDMNGYEATIEIKKFKPNLPIIAQTAYAISGDREQSLEAGCDDYISKPINKGELFRLINKHL